jgi:HlyD family secretion protein/macrolide-specific efflux system membrane fusion protein
MTARIEVTVSLGSNVLAVPRDYLGTDASGQYYALKGTDRWSATVQVVKVGRFSDHMIEILSGLSAGDRIISLYQAPAEVTS